MRTMLSFDFWSPHTTFRGMEMHDRLGPRLWPDYNERRKRGLVWNFDVQDREVVTGVRLRLLSLLPAETHPVEMLTFEDISGDDVFSADFVEMNVLAGIIPGVTAGLLTRNYPAQCSACGNRYQPAEPEFPVPLAKLSRRKFFTASIIGELQLVGTVRLREWYERSGFTGLSFSRIEGPDQELYRVHLAQHKWTDRSGVCAQCEMKTNVTSISGIFNLLESYKFDFQFVRCWKDTRVIVSQRAFRKAQATRELRLPLKPDIMPVPMVPGHLSDVIMAEDRICTPDAPPLRMLTY